MFNINKIKSQISEQPLLFGNRYQVYFGPNFMNFYNNIKIADPLSEPMSFPISENRLQNIRELYFMASSVSKPDITLDTTEVDVGGRSFIAPSRYNTGDITVVFYNTGYEYKAFHEYIHDVYNRDKHTFKYADEIKFDMNIREYDKRNQLIVSDVYQDCIINGIGGIQYSFEEAGSVETFDVNITFFKHYNYFYKSKKMKL